MIELTNVQKVIGQTTVLDIASLVVQPGDTAAVVGPEGSGRGELLALLLGQARPTAGSVRICGLDPFQDRETVLRRIGALLPQDGLYERQSVRSNLVFYCRLRGLAASRADVVLEKVGLTDRASMSAGKLPASLGRRLAFGRAILTEPAALILVNPFAGSDSASSTLMVRLIRQEAERGAAILILTNEAAGLAHLCQAVYFLEQGKLSQAETPTEVRHLEMPFKVPARLEGKVALVNLPDILFVSTEEGHALLHTTQGDFPSHLTITELEERLMQHGFFRAHRAYLVNLQRIKSIIPYTRDSFTLILDDATGTEIPLSKTSAKTLKDMLGY